MSAFVRVPAEVVADVMRLLDCAPYPVRREARIAREKLQALTSSDQPAPGSGGEPKNSAQYLQLLATAKADQMGAQASPSVASADSESGSAAEPASLPPLVAHSKSQYKRLVVQGANVLPPAAPSASPEVAGLVEWTRIIARDEATSPEYSGPLNDTALALERLAQDCDTWKRRFGQACKELDERIAEGKRLARERDEALREVEHARMHCTDETRIVDRVWQALGITTYAQAKPYAIHEHVAMLKERAEQAETALSAAREALREARQLGGAGWWGRLQAWIVSGAPTREEGIAAAKMITSMNVKIDAALAGKEGA